MIITKLFLFIYFTSFAVAYNCSAGFDCVAKQICTGAPTACPPGMYCDGHYMAAQMCLAGHYCPTPAESNLCPSGTVCAVANVEPTKCDPGSICPEGTGKQRPIVQVIFFGLIIFSVIFALVYSPKKKDNVVNTSSTLSDVSSYESELAVRKFNIEFNNLQMSVKSRGKETVVLESVTGYFKSSKLTAILGPSGAGKTSLMSILRGRVKHFSGAIYINGIEESIQKYKSISGYVPQDDIMLRNLSVKQILYHSARTRLPALWSEDKISQVVNDVINVLKLGHIQDSVIGDESNRGISGGERKRVNIGMELVALPSILFLDEPTTGLDSTTAQELVELLKSITRKGITIVAVLHQPRFEALNLFDDMLLLAKGGRTVYMGDSQQALEYFESLGYSCPSHFNPADVISGQVENKRNRLSITSGELVLDVNNVTPPIDFKSNIDFLAKQWQTRETTISEHTALQTSDDEAIRKTPNFIKQTLLFFYRALLVKFMDKKRTLLEMVYFCIPGLAMGAAASSYFYVPPLPQDMISLCPSIIRGRCENEAVLQLGVSITSFFFTMTVVVPSVLSGHQAMSLDKLMYYREASTGINKFAYFVGKNILDLLTCAQNALITTALYMIFAAPPGTWGKWYGTVYFLSFSGYGMGYFFGNIMEATKGTIVGLVVAIAFAVTSGLSPTLHQVNDYPPLIAIWTLAYPRWGAESIYLNVVEQWSDMRPEVAVNTAGYKLGNYGLDLAMMFIIGLLWRIAAMTALYFKNKHMQ